jgi:hypothetical protein
MANWMVTCKNCGNAFAFASISNSLSDFYLPQKPDFPPVLRKNSMDDIDPSFECSVFCSLLSGVSLVGTAA